MPKLKPDTQKARRARILDAAEHCIVRAGIHRTTMQDICREAGVSPGALYVYFDSKEALVAGLAERDRAEFAERFQQLSAAPDFLAALQALGERYFLDEPAHKRLLCVEIGVESTRNPRVAEAFRGVDTFVRQSFERLFQRLADEGRIAPALDIATLAQLFMVLGDGLFWRRAVLPDFAPQTVLRPLTDVMRGLLNPVPTAPAAMAHMAHPSKIETEKAS